MLKTPVTKTNNAPPTSRVRLSRSKACARVRTAGRSHSLGMTAHSLASRIGAAAKPATMCTPWLTAYSQAQPVGQSSAR